MNKAARLAALGLSAALAGSCGGGAPSKASFIAKADAICKAEEAAIAKLDRTNQAKYLTQGTALLRRELADLRALKRPTADRATLDGYLGALATVVDQAQKASRQAAAGDTTGASATFTAAGTAAEGARKTADRYGMKVCGTGGETVSPTPAPK